MLLSIVCPPAVVYIAFTLVHVIISIFEYDVKGALLQLLIGILITLLLQFLCLNDLKIISWIIVFLPFIFYTYMMVLLYNIFGLNVNQKTNSEKSI
jgi:hypothetical protein